MEIEGLWLRRGIEQLIARQPDDSSYEELVRELTFTVRGGLKDSHEGRTIPNEEMRHRIRTWPE